MPMPKKFVAKKTPNLFVWNLNQIQFLIFFIFASVITQPKCQTSFPRLEIQSQNNLLKALNPIKMARVVKGPVMKGLHHLGLVSRKSCIKKGSYQERLVSRKARIKKGSYHLGLVS